MLICTSLNVGSERFLIAFRAVFIFLSLNYVFKSLTHFFFGVVCLRDLLELLVY